MNLSPKPSKMRVCFSAVFAFAVTGVYYAKAASLATEEIKVELDKNVSCLSLPHKRDELMMDAMQLNENAEEIEDEQEALDTSEAEQEAGIMEAAAETESHESELDEKQENHIEGEAIESEVEADEGAVREGGNTEDTFEER